MSKTPHTSTWFPRNLANIPRDVLQSLTQAAGFPRNRCCRAGDPPLNSSSVPYVGAEHGLEKSHNDAEGPSPQEPGWATLQTEKITARIQDRKAAAPRRGLLPGIPQRAAHCVLITVVPSPPVQVQSTSGEPHPPLATPNAQLRLHTFIPQLQDHHRLAEYPPGAVATSAHRQKRASSPARGRANSKQPVQRLSQNITAAPGQRSPPPTTATAGLGPTAETKNREGHVPGAEATAHRERLVSVDLDGLSASLVIQMATDIRVRRPASPGDPPPQSRAVDSPWRSENFVTDLDDHLTNSPGVWAATDPVAEVLRRTVAGARVFGPGQADRCFGAGVGSTADTRDGRAHPAGKRDCRAHRAGRNQLGDCQIACSVAYDGRKPTLPREQKPVHLRPLDRLPVWQRTVSGPSFPDWPRSSEKMINIRCAT